MIDPAEVRAALGRERLTLPDPVPPHPLLADRRELGRGESSIVLDHPDPARVFKLVSSPADFFLYTADDRPRGPHFPVVFADHGVVGRARSGHPFHLLELERLQRLRDGTPAAEAAATLIARYWCACRQWRALGADMGRIALYHLALDPPAAGDTLAQALKALSDFVEAYQVMPDILAEDNLMMRADGTLVFSDPVFLG